MSLANYTVPFAAPGAAPYLANHNFGVTGAAAAAAAAALNSLVYDRRGGVAPLPYPQSSPNRRNDPYRGHNPSIPPPQQRPLGYQQPYGARYYTDTDYDKKSKVEEDYPSDEKKYFGRRKATRKSEVEEAEVEDEEDSAWPDHPPGYTRIPNTFNSVPEPGAKTSVHAVLDFDDDFDDYSYEDEEDGRGGSGGATAASAATTDKTHVTPIEGPILIKNGSVPVVPLYSYPTINNGSLVQIPILWTALSLALGLEIRGEIIRGVPCIKRFHQLFCPTAGNSYPIERIERFIDDNKALMKRMYGEFQMSSEFGPPAKEIFENRRRNVKREAGDGEDGPDPPPLPHGSYTTSKSDSYFAKHRQSRQSFRNNQNSESGRVDACESKIEIVTPYWASNSAGKIRAIVNTQHFEQAIHQEVCSKVQTKRCVGDCGCEQKYKWHRLLAYDPDNDCKGIFMDWFLFPSCCVCRCNPTFGN